MKKIMGTLAIYASLAIVALASFANVSELKAQTPTPAPAPAQTPAAAQTTCTDEVKSALYADFTKFRTTDPAKAYDAGKKYMAACPADVAQVKSLRERLAKTDLTPEAKTQAEAELKVLAIPNYLEKWTAQYDKDARKIKLNNLFVIQRKYAEALPAAKEVLADEPDNITGLTALGYGGYALAVSTKNESGNAEAITYAKKAIAAIEGGKAPESWAPFKSKDDTLGYLYYSVGYLERATNSADALKNFIKAAQLESDLKRNSQTYAFIANAYEEEYAKQSAAYTTTFGDKPETPESKLAAENINQLVDRVIDALARAVSVAGSDAGAQTAKAQWLARLTELYKFRNKSEAGLNEMIVGVMSKPLPPVPTPITTLPTPAATATPTPGTATNTAGSTTAPGATAPAVNKTTMTPTALAATPKVTPTALATTPKAPVKPKTRNNHRRH